MKVLIQLPRAKLHLKYKRVRDRNLKSLNNLFKKIACFQEKKSQESVIFTSWKEMMCTE